MPTPDGFFFGSTAYDQYYVQDLEYTKRTLEALLAEGPDGYFTINASW